MTYSVIAQNSAMDGNFKRRRPAELVFSRHCVSLEKCIAAACCSASFCTTSTTDNDFTFSSSNPLPELSVFLSQTDNLFLESSICIRHLFLESSICIRHLFLETGICIRHLFLEYTAILFHLSSYFLHIGAYHRNQSKHYCYNSYPCSDDRTDKYNEFPMLFHHNCSPLWRHTTVLTR